MKRLKLRAMVLSLLLAIGMNALAGETVVDNPRFPRKALVAPDCMINTMINVVSVGSGTDGMNCLLDENLDNYATLAGLAKVGVLSDPIVSVKDLKYTYPAGTKAGFCVVNESGKLLDLDLLGNVKVYFYLDGKLQEGVTVEQSDKNLLSLSLIQMGESDATLSLTAQSTKPFDEIGLFVEGVNVSALSATKVKYAFVGDERKKTLTINNFEDIEVDAEKNKDNATDTELNNTCSFATRLSGILGTEDHVTLSKFGEFPKGTRVGFKFKLDAALNLKLAEAMKFKLYDGNSLVQETTVNANLLKIGLLGTTDYDISVQAIKKFNKVELVVSHKLLGLLTGLLSKLSFYYGYIEEEPIVTHHHDFNASMNPVICENEESYQLYPNTGDVRWELVSKPAGDNTVQVSENGFVSNMTPGVTGEYKFRVTASDGCTEEVVLTKGIQHGGNSGCNQPIADEMVLSESIHESSGALISITDLESWDNIIDQDMSTYATYTGGLTLVDNLQIVGVKKKDAQSKWTSESSGKRIGFVVEMNNGMLGVNALEFYQIRLYNEGQKVHERVISQWNTISAGLIGNNNVQKVRFSIEVPANIEFDEITLWKSGVLGLQFSNLRIYGVYMEELSATCDDPLGSSSTIISRTTTGASINYGHTGFFGLAQISTFMKDLQNLIDDDVDNTYTYSDGVKAGVKASYAVNLGRTFTGKRYQVGLIMEKNTYLANLEVINQFSFSTYFRGQLKETKTGWNVLGLDAIGYGDKIYLLMNPENDFDEVRLETGELVEALSGLKLYGLFVRNDADGDGIPDGEDENSCGPEEPQQPEEPGDIKFTLSAEHLCQQSNLTVTIKGTAGAVYKISCPEQGINDVEVTVQANGEGSWTGAMPNAAREATLTVTTQDDAKSATKKFAVHPLQTTWDGSENTDWNNWDNWTNGSPIGCSNVIIPAGCANYPVLTAASENLCSHIHFEMGAEVVNTHFLTYDRASVDMTLNEADRYYTLSAPLHGMVTGDMFIPADGNPPVFTEANETNAPQNRFNPRIYQRLWASNAKGQPITGSQIEVAPDETRWTPPFNALAEKYEPGKGFSMKAVRNAAEGDLTFRFPKTHTEYEYVTDQNQPTGIKENINRDNAGRFIYEKGDGVEAFPFTVTLSNKDAGTTFLAGNPFMAHIDVQKFMQENPSIETVKVYDGNNANSQILVDGELVSNGADYTHIAPMQSVFVTVANDAQTLNVTYTADMLASASGSLLKSHRMAAENHSDLSLSATAGKHVANTLVRLSAAASKAYVPGEDAELLVDNEVRPAIALFSVAGGKSLDIQQLDGADRIPLGFYLQTPDTVSLTIRKSGSGEWDGWYLSDIQLQKNYPLETAETVIPLGVLSTNVGRFFLVKGNPTANESIADGDIRCYCYREGTDRIVVRSTNAPMKRCEIYSASGTLVDRANGESTEYRLRPTSGVNIIKVYPEGKEPQVFKVSCY
ncbi:hypothetical protein [Phocaeicola coprocola]|uniref:hypothetical protein n=1 Tax=Phocaeicola coprocola TaxID=310298 RepID=UPI00241E5349|nr:hypothetical protein [Phocaeicola coprocola]